MQVGIRVARQYSLSMLLFCRTRHGRVDIVSNFISLSLAGQVQSCPFLMCHNVGTLFQCDTVVDGVSPRDRGCEMSITSSWPGPWPRPHNRNKRQLQVIMNSCSAQTVSLSDDCSSTGRGELGLVRAERNGHWTHLQS